VSGRQLADGDVIEDLRASADRHAVALDRLKLEITESLTLDTASTVAFLERCRAAGVRVSMDDFGTGLLPISASCTGSSSTRSSWTRASCARCSTSPRAMEVVRAVVSMAKALGADLVAEGVESAEERDCLEHARLRLRAGYLIGKPAERQHILAGSRHEHARSAGNGIKGMPLHVKVLIGFVLGAVLGLLAYRYGQGNAFVDGTISTSRQPSARPSSTCCSCWCCR
jgi:EAL domain-containing protein (putative c-di-GMP-specific phosphodiesterase class I)